MALWIAAGANPKEVADRIGHSSVTFNLDRHGHLHQETDTAPRDNLDVLHDAAQPTPESTVVRLLGRLAVAPVWP